MCDRTAIDFPEKFPRSSYHSFDRVRVLPHIKTYLNVRSSLRFEFITITLDTGVTTTSTIVN
jgi:hypothetical protein